MSEKKVPELRFKGFTGDWEQRKLGNVADIIGGGTPKTNNEDYWNGDIDWYSPAEIGEQRYVNGSRKKITMWGLQKSSAKILPVGTVLFTSRAGIGNTAILKKEGATNQGFQSILPQKNQLDTYFIYSKTDELKRYGKATGGGSTFIEVSGKQMAKMPISIPSFEEQIKIGNFFKQLDDTIALHQEKLEKLKQLKKGYLQVMFPKTGEKNPQLRFANFSSNWEQRMLDELVTQVIREVPKPSQPYKRVSVRSHAKGTFQQKVDDPKKVAMDKLFVVKENDLIVNITFAWEHAIAIASKSDNGLLVSHRFPTYRADGKSNINFLRYLISMENFRKKLEFISPGGAGRNRVLNKKDFLKLKVSIPMDIEEQQIIGQFFKRFDDAIILQHNRVEKLKKLKQVYLKLLFI